MKHPTFLLSSSRSPGQTKPALCWPFPLSLGPSRPLPGAPWLPPTTPLSVPASGETLVAFAFTLKIISPPKLMAVQFHGVHVRRNGETSANELLTPRNVPLLDDGPAFQNQGEGGRAQAAGSATREVEFQAREGGGRVEARCA